MLFRSGTSALRIRVVGFILINQATGQAEHQITISQGMPHFSSLSLSGGTAFVSTLAGITAVNGA